MLAQNLLSNICAKLIDFLKEIINSEYFINRHRQSPTDFVRQRKLPFSTLIFFLINFVKGSYQDELDHFFKAVHCLDVARNFVSKAALAKARMKLKYDAFIELNLRLIHFLYDNFTVSKWNDFNLLAVDGTAEKRVEDKLGKTILEKPFIDDSDFLEKVIAAYKKKGTSKFYLDAQNLTQEQKAAYYDRAIMAEKGKIPKNNPYKQNG
jgi:hypothetical protein